MEEDAIQVDVIVSVMQGSRQITCELATVCPDNTFMELLENVADGSNFSLRNCSVEKVELTLFRPGSTSETMSSSTKPLVIKTQAMKTFQIMCEYNLDHVIYTLKDIRPTPAVTESAFAQLMQTSQSQPAL